jgi:hypothetical protein
MHPASAPVQAGPGSHGRAHAGWQSRAVTGPRLAHHAHSDTAWLPRALARIAISRPAAHRDKSVAI